MKIPALDVWCLNYVNWGKLWLFVIFYIFLLFNLDVVNSFQIWSCWTQASHQHGTSISVLASAHVGTDEALVVTWAGHSARLLQDDLFVSIHCLLQVSTEFLIHHTARILPRAVRHEAGHIPKAQAFSATCTLRKHRVLTLTTTVGHQLWWKTTFSSPKGDWGWTLHRNAASLEL